MLRNILLDLILVRILLLNFLIVILLSSMHLFHQLTRDKKSKSIEIKTLSLLYYEEIELRYNEYHVI
jgi:hypothetical protein